MHWNVNTVSLDPHLMQSHFGHRTNHATRVYTALSLTYIVCCVY